MCLKLTEGGKHGTKTAICQRSRGMRESLVIELVLIGGQRQSRHLQVSRIRTREKGGLCSPKSRLGGWGNVPESFLSSRREKKNVGKQTPS